MPPPVLPGVCNSCSGVDGQHLAGCSASSDRSADMVNHPPHCRMEDPAYEPINVIEAWRLGFHLGSAVKYIARAGRKDPTKLVEDLKKAAWYLNRYIEKVEALNDGR